MPKVIDLPTATSMDNGDYLLMEESSGGTKKITRQNAIQKQLSFSPYGIASISDLNTAASSGSCAIYFSENVAVGGVTIKRYARGFVSNPINADDAVIMVVDSSRNFYHGFRNGSTWNVRTDAVLSSTISPASGATVATNYVYKTDRIVQFVYWFNFTLASGWNTVGTLPDGYRPMITFDTALLDNGSATPVAQVKINTNGIIQVYKLNSSSNNFRLSTTFISSN